MDTESRFLIVLGISVFALFYKWFVLRFVATEPINKMCKRWFGSPPKIIGFGYLFRSLGWDLANAALGLMVLASIFKNSNLRKLIAEMGEFRFNFYATLVMFFCVIYGFAVFIKYIFLESAEKACIPSGRNGKLNLKRFWCALVLWATGSFMLLNSSWFVVGE